jgi:hypothetical protein
MNVGNAVAWGPMAPEQLCDVLRMAAEVAAADSGHDLLTALDVLNKDWLHPAGRPQLHEADLWQVARVLLAAIAVDGQIGSIGGEVAAVNAWLAQRGRAQGRLDGPENVLADLFRSAAEQIEAGRRDEPTVGA